MSDLVVNTCFWSAFILDIAIMGYAFFLIKDMGEGGILRKVTYYTALSAAVFGLHHMLEIFLEDIPYGITVAESIEGIAAMFLGAAVFQLYNLTRG